MTFIGALRHDGIEAPWVLDGPINAEAFKTYVRAELVEILKTEDIVVLDNSPPAGGIRRAPLNSHKGKAVRATVKAIGARLFFLPSYSPDLNPIEQAFAKIKHAMTVCCDTLWRFLRREGLSFKKSVAASEQERPDVARRARRMETVSGADRARAPRLHR